MAKQPCRFCMRVREFLTKYRKSRFVTLSVSRRNRGSVFVQALITIALIVIVLASLIWFGSSLNG